MFGKILPSNYTYKFDALNLDGNSEINAGNPAGEILINRVESDGFSLLLDAGTANLGPLDYNIDIGSFIGAGNLTFRDTHKVRGNKATPVMNQIATLLLDDIIGEARFEGDMRINSFLTDGTEAFDVNDIPAGYSSTCVGAYCANANEPYDVHILGSDVVISGFTLFYSADGTLYLSSSQNIDFVLGFATDHLNIGPNIYTQLSTVLVQGGTTTQPGASLTSRGGGAGSFTFDGQVVGDGFLAQLGSANVFLEGGLSVDNNFTVVGGNVVFGADVVTGDEINATGTRIAGDGNVYSTGNMRLAANTIDTEFISTQQTVTFGGFITDMDGIVDGQTTFLKADFVAQGKIIIEAGANIENFHPVGDQGGVQESNLTDTITGSTSEDEFGGGGSGEEGDDDELFELLALGDEEEEEEEEEDQEEEEEQTFEYVDQDEKPEGESEGTGADTGEGEEGQPATGEEEQEGITEEEEEQAKCEEGQILNAKGECINKKTSN